MRILILTTAINRPDLHKATFRALRKILKGGDHKIFWLINIDRIDYLDATIEQTEKNIRRIFKNFDNIKFKFFHNDSGKGRFNSAVRTLVKNAKKHIGKVDCVLYFEDDYWAKIEKAEDFEKELKKSLSNMSGEDWIINLTVKNLSNKANYASFQPQLWSRKMFKSFIKVYMKNKDREICPEWLLSRELFKYKNLPEFEISGIYLFSGSRVGRQWLKENGLIKVGNFYEERD